MAEPTTTETTPEGGTPPEKTLTQAEVDAIVRDRLQRERQKYGDYDQLKSQAAEYQKLQDAQKSDAQLLADRLAAIEKQLGLKDKAIEELTGALAGERRANVAGSVASRLGAFDPQDANILAAISVIDPAGVNAEREIEASIAALQKTKPYLFRQGTRTPEPFNPAGGSTSGVAETDQQIVGRILGQLTGNRNYGPLGRG